MPTSALIKLTRASHKRKLAENASNKANKKVRVNKMKELAGKFIKSKRSKEDKIYLDLFYKQNKLLYPWLKKESLRWHIRHQRTTKEVQQATTTNHPSQPVPMQIIEEKVSH